MIKFAFQYIAVMLGVMIVIAVLGYFLGDSIQARLPDDGINFYPSYEAALASTRRGHEISDRIESILVTVSAVVIFVVMYRRYKSKNQEPEGAAGTEG